MKYIVTGGAGFIGSHLVDKLVELGHEVIVIDNLRSGKIEQVNPKADFLLFDITDDKLYAVFELFKADGVFHLAAIARTPWCIEDPLLAAKVNDYGTVNVYESARKSGITQKVVAASSNVIYAAHTPYRCTKEHVNDWARVYRQTYGMKVQTLVFSNVYGTRQSEEGPSPNVFASLRKSKRENGYVEITGDGEQSRDFTHVSDIVDGLIRTMNYRYEGKPVDLCTGKNWTLNEIAKMFDAEVKYIPERHGDIKHIVQDPTYAKLVLEWEAKVALPEGIKDCL